MVPESAKKKECGSVLKMATCRTDARGELILQVVTDRRRGAGAGLSRHVNADITQSLQQPQGRMQVIFILRIRKLKLVWPKSRTLGHLPGMCSSPDLNPGSLASEPKLSTINQSSAI